MLGRKPASFVSSGPRDPAAGPSIPRRAAGGGNAWPLAMAAGPLQLGRDKLRGWREGSSTAGPVPGSGSRAAPGRAGPAEAHVPASRYPPARAAHIGSVFIMAPLGVAFENNTGNGRPYASSVLVYSHALTLSFSSDRHGGRQGFKLSVLHPHSQKGVRVFSHTSSIIHVLTEECYSSIPVWGFAVLSTAICKAEACLKGVYCRIARAGTRTRASIRWQAVASG